MKCLSVPHRKMACKSSYTYIHTYIHGRTRERFYMIAQCVMIRLHVQRSAQPMLLVVQEQHTCNLYSEKDECFVSCLAIIRLERHPADSLLTFCITARVNLSLCFSYRTFHMTTLRWSTTWTLPTAWWWRATCSRGPATPLRPGTGI